MHQWIASKFVPTAQTLHDLTYTNVACDVFVLNCTYIAHSVFQLTYTNVAYDVFVLELARQGCLLDEAVQVISRHGGALHECITCR